MMILALVLIIGGLVLRSWISQTVAEKYQDGWNAEHDYDLNRSFLNGKDFRKFRSAKLRQDRKLFRLNALSDFLMTAGILVMVLTPIVRAAARLGAAR